MTPLTAQQTMDRAKAVLQSGAASGLPELLKLIESLSIDIDKVNKITGMDITVVTSAKTDEECLELLKFLGFPFKTK